MTLGGAEDRSYGENRNLQDRRKASGCILNTTWEAKTEIPVETFHELRQKNFGVTPRNPMIFEVSRKALGR